MSTQDPTGTPTNSADQLSSPARKRSGTVSAGVAIAIAVVLLLVGIGGGYFLGTSLNKSTSTSTSQVQLTETGSSLLYPLMTRWGGNYSVATVSAASTGSGTGQSDAELGLVNIGASDGYLANASVTSLINLPVAISAQLIYYNLPGITAHLNLNGTVLAMIYNGTITTWNNPMILAAQPTAVQTQLGALSSEQIHPIKRSDSSGDTFLFTSLCYMSWSQWSYGFSTSALTGDTVATGATGNSGVVSALQSTTNSIGYVGISYESSANGDGLHYAALGNNDTIANGTYAAAAADYILPSASNISADANLGLTHLEFSTYQLAVSLILGGSPAGAIDLLHGGGGTNPAAGTSPYPDVNLEYTLIKTAPTGPTVTSTALAATVQFLEWAISNGNWAPGSLPSAYINAVSFIPLTPEVTGYDMQELASVQP
ncbi:MAG: substrate-binding domain-containing protein [Thermoplasmata archaeon]